jgi:hypothetical protein
MNLLLIPERFVLGYLGKAIIDRGVVPLNEVQVITRWALILQSAWTTHGAMRTTKSACCALARRKRGMAPQYKGRWEDCLGPANPAIRMTCLIRR